MQSPRTQSNTTPVTGECLCVVGYEAQGLHLQGEEEEARQCWLCLEGSNDANGEVRHHCKCPSLQSHLPCLSRWQMQRCGALEETQCRFCRSTLPKWTDCLYPEPASTTPSTPPEPSSIISPTIAIVFNEKRCLIRVSEGPDGAAEFRAAVKSLTGLDTDFDVSFEITLPSVTRLPACPPKLTLPGISSYETAAACAHASARMQSNFAQGRRTQEEGAPDACNTQATEQRRAAAHSKPPSQNNPRHAPQPVGVSSQQSSSGNEKSSASEAECS
ncbi:hypothetical protein DUNSADRAFT_14344 [Dunaliella salina]|uniref:RING-CH-type domain-containing protein n=1 Tax=Dunaliella salina TaxID=3046 RepID=A0ABQ7G7J5_DUNSA|nr:hypothetical protein DUNSADRAFT_14344 [Dunaliella salina]|eukprot:KAF5830578.1 hypothetical protein DUNSADRAFT_14344 [Dunaliella salina]